MKKNLKKGLSFLLILGMIVMGAPATAFAQITDANDQDVITSATYGSYNVSVSDRIITVTVPHSYSGTVNAVNLNLTWDSSIDNSSSSIEWNTGYSNVAVGSNVNGTATYKLTGGTESRTASYTLAVARALKVNPTASGTINLSQYAGETIQVNLSDIKAKYEKNDGVELEKIKIASKQGSENDGSFKVNSGSYVLGSDISLGGSASIEYVAGKTGTDEYVISYYESENPIAVGTVDLKIEVKNPVIDSISVGKVEIDSTKAFPISDVNSKFKTKSGSTSDFTKIIFTSIPDSQKGVLYKGYTSSSSKGTAIKKYNGEENTVYTMSDFLSNLKFLAGKTTGEAVYEYTAYKGNQGYDGKVTFTVYDSDEDDDTDLKQISYSVKYDDEVDFETSDFTSALKKVSDYSLKYIKITGLPSSSKGTLYFEYDSDDEDGTEVKKTDKFFRTGSSNDLIEDLTFVSEDSAGTVYISYIAYDSNSKSFEGKVKITISKDGKSSDDDMDDIVYSSKNGEPAEFNASDFKKELKNVSDEGLDYIKFEIPKSSYGTLYYDYDEDDTVFYRVNSTTKYYRSSNSKNAKLIDNVSFVPKSGYTGTVYINYTAFDGEEEEFDGRIKINVTNNNNDNNGNVIIIEDKTKSKYFKDVDGAYDWVAEKIDYLYEKEIVKGSSESDGSVKYNPASDITRGDFMLMLYRAFNLNAQIGTNFSDVPKNSYYYDAIGAAKTLGIAQGSYGKFNPKSSLTREDAMVLLYRTITTVGKKQLTTSSSVSKFTDSKNISSYAVTAVGTLVNAGVINGYSDGTFVPKGKLTRAEMAVILYNVDKL